MHRTIAIGCCLIGFTAYAQPCPEIFPIDTQGVHSEQQVWLRTLNYEWSNNIVLPIDSMEFIWKFAVRFTLQDTVAMNFTDEWLRSQMKLLWKPCPQPKWRWPWQKGIINCSETDSLYAGISELYLLYRRVPIGILREIHSANGWAGTSYQSHPPWDPVLTLTYAQQANFIFRPYCNLGLVEEHWLGFIGFDNCIYWYNSALEKTFTTDEVARDHWKMFIIRWYDEDQ